MMKDDVKKFLESSVLEEYVLGLTSPEQQAEVERYLTYPEVQAAYRQLQENIEQLARSSARAVPPDSKAIIDRRIDELSDKPSTNTSADKTSPWLIAASIGLLIAALSACYLFYQNNQLEEEQFALNQQLAQLQADCAEQQEAFALLKEKDELFRDPATDRFLLSGSTPAGELEVVAYRNTNQQQSLIQLVSLPDLPADRCFQMWADVDGEMKSLGILRRDQPLMELPYLAAAESLNITVEPAGGSQQATVANLVANVRI